MIKQILLAIILFGFFSCNNNSNKKDTSEKPSTISVQEDDLEMNNAIKTAIQTLHRFEKALKSDNPNLHSFSLKKQFEYDGGIEHIWISDITRKGNNYYGIVSNLPEYTTDISFGDTIPVEHGKISDWMYIDGQELFGGYTIKVLRNRMTDLERKQFDQESGLIFE